MEEVEQLLAGGGLDRYAGAFEEEGYDELDLLLTLSEHVRPALPLASLLR